MVIYLDLAFLTNFLSDVLALYLTARLSGFVLRPIRLILAAALGGIYGTLCLIPQLHFLSMFILHIAVAALLMLFVFGAQKMFLRMMLLFYFLSCMLGGVFMSIAQYIAGYGVSDALRQMNWKVFFLVGCMCFFLLSIVFSGSAKHVVSGEICRGTLKLRDQMLSLDVLLDTGHTLSDPYSGAPAMTVWFRAAEPLFNHAERAIILQLQEKGSSFCVQQLAGITPGKFLLLPYRAVGVDSSMLLAFRADSLIINRKTYHSVLIAISPSPVSDGGGYTALWGGERMVATSDAKGYLFSSGVSDKAGIDSSR